jgi:small subunit ribosomal protein S2
MSIPSEKDLIAAACHLGHPREKWNPKMAPFLYGTRKGIHIFDLTKTKEHLEHVCHELQKLQTEGKTILLVSTKQQSIPLIEEMGELLHQPVVTKKWIPGLLTNWPTLKRRIQYYLDLRKSFQTGEVEKYTKKEQTDLRKEMIKLDSALSGVAHMTGLPQAMFIVDAVRDNVAVLEAKKLGIPVYGICDSNANPDLFASFVPANDDAVKSIEIILRTVLSAMQEGKSKKAEKDTVHNKEAVAA